MRQALWVWFAFAGTAACSYIFELPATTTSPTDPDASTDASALEDAPPPYDAPPVVPFCASQSGPFLYC
ncbi:MAG TPA: hypothetical protein VM580_18690, partial [Labilithrix sp.]|nr:hypothetical protein [Labilithrix sp.]